jgi:hypothetical protein
MNVGAADRGGLDLDEDIVRAGAGDVHRYQFRAVRLRFDLYDRFHLR